MSPIISLGILAQPTDLGVLMLAVTDVNTQVDVALVVLAGGGSLVVDGRRHFLEASTLAHVPRSREQEIRAGAEGLTYVTAHHRRGPLTVGIRHDRSGHG